MRLNFNFNFNPLLYFLLFKLVHVSSSTTKVENGDFTYSPLFGVENQKNNPNPNHNLLSRKRQTSSSRNCVTFFQDTFNSCFAPEILKYDQLNRSIRCKDIDSLKQYLLNDDSYYSALKLNFDTIFITNNQNLLSDISNFPCFDDLEVVKGLLDSADKYRAISSLDNILLLPKLFNLLIQNRTKAHEYIEMLLLAYPLLTYKGLTIFHFAVKEKDFEFVNFAQLSEKYLHLADFSNRLPSDFISDLHTLAFIYKRLQLEYSIGHDIYCKSDSPVFPSSLLLSFTLKAMEYHDDTVIIDELITHVQSCCLDPLKSGELFYLYALKGEPESLKKMLNGFTIEYGLDFEEFYTTDHLQAYCNTVPDEVIMSIFKMSLRMKNELVLNQILEASQLIDKDNKKGLLSRLLKATVSSQAYHITNKLIDSHPVIIHKGLGQTILHALAINDDLNMVPLLKEDVNYFFTLDNNNNNAFCYAKSREVKEFILERFVFEYSENVEKLSAYSSQILNFFKKIFSFENRKLVSQALNILKTFDEKFSFNYFGELFNAQIKSELYKNIEVLLGIDPLISFQGKNVLHFAAQLNDKKLFQLTAFKTENIFYLHRLDDFMATPISYIESYEMYELFSKRITCEGNCNSKFLMDISQQMSVKNEILKNENVYYLNLSNRLKLVLNEKNIEKNLEISNFFFDRSENVLKSFYLQVSALSNPSAFYNPYNYPNVKVIYTTNTEDILCDDTEWISLLIESFFKPNPTGTADLFTAPLFEIIDRESGLYAPNKNYSPDVFKFAGSILSLAFINRIEINAVFIQSVYRKIYGFEPCHPDYLKFQSPTIYARVKQSEQGQDFNVYNDPAYELLYEHFKLEIDALAEGFNISRNMMIFKYFTIDDFKAVLKGKHLNSVTPYEFIKHCDFSALDIKFTFTRILESFDQNQMGRLIKLITNRNSLPIDGLAGLVNRIQIDVKHIKHLQVERPNILHVPDNYSEEKLKFTLLQAINKCN